MEKVEVLNGAGPYSVTPSFKAASMAVCNAFVASVNAEEDAILDGLGKEGPIIGQILGGAEAAMLKEQIATSAKLVASMMRLSVRFSLLREMEEQTRVQDGLCCRGGNAGIEGGESGPLYPPRWWPC